MKDLLILNYCNIPYRIHKTVIHNTVSGSHYPSLASAGASEHIWLWLRLKVNQEVSGIFLHFASGRNSLLTCK